MESTIRTQTSAYLVVRRCTACHKPDLALYKPVAPPDSIAAKYFKQDSQDRKKLKTRSSARMRKEERSAKGGVHAKTKSASFVDLILSRLRQSRGPASAAAQAWDQHNNLPYSIPQPYNIQSSTMTPPALSMDRPVTPDGPRAVNGGLYSGVQTPKTPVASTLSLTEYSANPTPPKESTKEKAQSLVPEAFLLPNGYPDVSSRTFCHHCHDISSSPCLRRF